MASFSFRFNIFSVTQEWNNVVVYVLTIKAIRISLLIPLGSLMMELVEFLVIYVPRTVGNAILKSNFHKHESRGLAGM